MRSAEAFMAAVRCHQQGKFAEADRLYRKVLATEPRHLHALHLRGALAHAAGRNEDAVKLIGRAIALDAQIPDFHYNIGLALWALNHRHEAADHWARAVALNPGFAEARLNLGNALREQGRVDEAVAQHRAAVQLQPQSPHAHNSLGLSLAMAGQHDDAIAHYARAIAAQPGLVDAHLNLAMSHFSCGRADEAVAATMRSIDIQETSENKTLFARLVSGLSIVRDDPNLRRLLTRALRGGWSGPAAFAPAAMTLVCQGPALVLIARAVEAFPERPSCGEFAAAAVAALSDPLLQALLDSTPIYNVDLEKFLAACRDALLEAAAAAPSDDGGEAMLGTAAALARQCFINEYVYAEIPAEQTRAAELRDRLDSALATGTAVSPLWVAAVASYFPLHELAAAAALLTRSWPAPVASLIAQQIRAPQDEATLRAGIRKLTPIEDDVSRAVQTQYEANPYPRWMSTAIPRKYADVAAHLRELLPAAQFRPPGKARRLDILVAGCGTGRHAVMTARQYEGARTLAIDLSTSSLAYAIAKARSLGIESIEFAQADIMQLGTLERMFDLIESIGVLHHMADPYAGWRVLLSLLRPGGFMRIGLYSETSRSGVVAARTLIAQSGYGSTTQEIRRFRAELMRKNDETARDVLQFRDFFSTSECRDLLFHTQEHRMRLPEIKHFLVEEGLQLLGLEVDSTVARHYAMRFPADKTLTNLDQWDVFETDNPRTFRAMYRLWVQKRG